MVTYDYMNAVRNWRNNRKEYKMKYESDCFKLEELTIWPFPNRGSWATYSGEYRGNRSPFISRNLILCYTNENDWILDRFLGSGTTLI